MQTFIFGRSSKNFPIVAYQFGQRGPEVLILGGVHGNEPEGVICALGLLDEYAKGFSHPLRLTLVPMFNIDGVIKGERQNGNGVDLNRNLPTSDWTKNVPEKKYYPGPSPNSEPENQALVDFIKSHKLQFIISLHSWHPLLNVNGACEDEAEAIKRVTGYEIKKDIGYPTPGCLGTYTGLEREIPTITYEIERGLDSTAILRTHCFAVDEALKIVAARGKH